MKAFLERNKKALINMAVIIATLVALSIISVVLLVLFDIVYFDDGMQFNAELFHSFKTSWYGWIIFILLQTVLSVLLCVIPGASMAFILLSKTLYDYAWQAFILSFASVMISSVFMYLLGRLGGYKLCVKLLGKEDCEKSLGLLRDKGTVFFPLMMLFPVFPDDALVMVAGTLKMSLKWFIPSILIARGIGIATIVFGLSLVPFDKFTAVWHWILFIAVCAVLIVAVFFAAIKFNKWLEKRKKSNHDDAENSEN